MITVVVALIVSCSLSGGANRKAERKARNESEAATIQDELAKVPGVVKVEVRYSDDFTNPGSGSADLVVEPGTDLKRVADLAAGAIWRSRLDPLKTIRVGVGDGEGGSRGIALNYIVLGNQEDPDDNTAELEARYGPRPIKTR